MNDIVSPLTDKNGDRVRAPCPLCRAKSGVTDSRPWRSVSDNARWQGGTIRRRQCSECQYKWSTIELPYELVRHLPALEADLRRLAGEAEAMADAIATLLRHLP